ncbi:unnamed protein product [Oppiella nova]|uniref:C2H2-type domain-containing protein n=1 Tax=Oppiella nova TaxID=334625 RepID=A0A7R9MLS5_9ACAR|nr:unnamed protein product [Oppiella nova]CAG2178554.1 unnamed protein product [Oppiella nova]
MRAHEGKKVVFKRYKSKNNSNPNSDYDFKGELKKFPCDWPGCERRFRYANNLDTHLKAHQKSDLHKSEKVVKQSNERKSRKQSISKPKVSKKFRCDWPGCPSIYSTRSMLLQHTNKHTGAKPFACLHCDKRFSYKTTLHSHIQFNHKFAENSTEKAFKGLLAHDRKMHQKGNDNDFNDSYNIEEICDNTDNYSQIQPMSQTSGSHYPSIQSNVIRLDRIRAFNSTRIQIPNEHNYQSLPQMIGHNNPTTSRVFQCVVENLVKPQKEVRNVVKLTNIAGNETITKELPIPCTHETCWRRFKTPKALEWHLKKFHPQT